MTRNRRRLVALLAAALVAVVAVTIALSRGDGGGPGPRASASSEATASPSTRAERREVAPPAASPSRGRTTGETPPSARPSPAARGALVDPVARAGSARGALVRGFPQRAVPVAQGSRVQASSVSPGGGRLQVALSATTAADPQTVLRFYGVQLARRGFTTRAVPANGGSSATGFRHGRDSLVVTVTPSGRGTSYTVFGTLTPKAA